MDNVAVARAYLAAIEARQPLAPFLDEAVLFEELPNRIKPGGARADRAAMLAGAERGKTLLSREHYEILSACADGDRVILEVRWSGTLAVAIGSLPAGGTMVARSAMFLTLRDGRITQQRNYDCFDPF